MIKIYIERIAAGQGESVHDLDIEEQLNIFNHRLNLLTWNSFTFMFKIDWSFQNCALENGIIFKFGEKKVNLIPKLQTLCDTILNCHSLLTLIVFLSCLNILVLWALELGYRCVLCLSSIQYVNRSIKHNVLKLNCKRSRYFKQFYFYV